MSELPRLQYLAPREDSFHKIHNTTTTFSSPERDHAPSTCLTAHSSGNIYKASAQFIVNQRIEKETGKNSLTLIKETLIEETDKKAYKNSFDEDLRQLVETRIKMTRQKLDNQNLQKLLKKRIEATRSILDLNKTTQ